MSLFVPEWSARARAPKSTKKNGVSLCTTLAHSKPVTLPMKSTTGWSREGRQESLEAIHSFGHSTPLLTKHARLHISHSRSHQDLPRTLSGQTLGRLIESPCSLGSAIASPLATRVRLSLSVVVAPSNELAGSDTACALRPSWATAGAIYTTRPTIVGASDSRAMTACSSALPATTCALPAVSFAATSAIRCVSISVRTKSSTRASTPSVCNSS